MNTWNGLIIWSIKQNYRVLLIYDRKISEKPNNGFELLKSNDKINL